MKKRELSTGPESARKKKITTASEKDECSTVLCSEATTKNAKRKNKDTTPTDIFNTSIEHSEKYTSEHTKNKSDKKKHHKEKYSTDEDSALTTNEGTEVIRTSLSEEASTPGLDPEKEAIREKKREKRRLKKEAARQEKAARQAAQTANSGLAEKSALEYLHQWSEDRSNWKFQTVRQTWLLQHMYDTDKVSDDDFAILLEYMDGLKGHSREVTSQKAAKMLEQAEEDSESESDNAKEEENEKSSEKKKLTEEQISRARQVIQLLT